MPTVTITLTEREVESLWSAFAKFAAEFESEERDVFNKTNFQDMKAHDRISAKIRASKRRSRG